eukprot:2553764-Pyramimonas_sp.AAC.1
MEFGLDVSLAAPLSPSPPRRDSRLVAARRLALNVGLATPLPPSPPRRRLIGARRLGLSGLVWRLCCRRRCPVAASSSPH